MQHIDYYLFPLSPFGYLAGLQLEEIAQKHGAQITYKPFGLMKVFEEVGTPPPAECHANKAKYRAQDIARVAKFNDMPVNLKPAHWPTNPAPACYAIIAAQAAGGGNVGALVHALFRACWAEEKNIAEDAVIKECLTANGFDAGLADSGLLSGAETFGRNTEEALKAGVFGTPSYVVDDEVFWGQDRLPHLDAYLAERA
jgi:2-hydroxychromene-2-carboxylate isomerase